jgi:AAA+ ATPase superfamily predicted ATPase
MVINAIQESSKLFLIGPRRYGKTSILRAASEQAEKDGAVILRYDVEAYPSLDLLARAMLIEATQRLSGSVERVGEKIKRFFGRLKPEVSYNPIDQTWSASLGVSDTLNPEREVPLLVDFLNGINKLAAEFNRPVGVILDEFQKIIEVNGQAAEGQIRAAIQRHEHVGYIFAGSKTRMLAEMTGHPSRPFYQLGLRCFIGPLPRDEFANFIRRNFERGGFTITDEAITSLLDLAEEVPHHVQMLAHQCWAALKESSKSAVTEKFVREQHALLVRQNNSDYSQIWNQLTAKQQKALMTVITAGGRGLLSSRAAKATGLSVATLQSSLKALLEKEILRQDEDGATIHYRFIDPFFADWISLVLSLNPAITKKQ